MQLLRLLILLVCSAALPLAAQPARSAAEADPFSGLRFRSIGPAVRSGRIGDIAVDPHDRSVWYVATASSNVWKTVNAGTTWTPIFDRYGSSSIGAVAVDPTNSSVVWLGTGENASQRSAGFGDGVYKSADAGRSWTNVGLEASEHVGKILIDPRNPDVVYVAAQGPLWAPGGDRGLYKTADGGTTWTRILAISENTGVADVVFDPRDPDVLYAASYQRRRHVGILVAGGPESRLYKSADAGATWQQLRRGLPDGDVGRIAIAVSPVDPDVVYALIAASGEASGFYRSANRGEAWTKMSDYIVVDPQYYGKIFPDPHRFDHVYAVDVIVHRTRDGGRTFERVNTRNKHVDNHEIVFDPNDPDYLMVGTDGGIYESWDRGATWRFHDNLPITQFYRVGLDNAAPFYNVYGGTQDNASVGGPSRTPTTHGIRNSDWFTVVGGDGFQVRVDPDDPNIVYGMSQYAGIVRYDRASGERVDIQPQPEPGEPALRWHWDAPLIISPHDGQRLYFAASRIFRSDDRADTWRAISPDLSRGIDRNQRPIMGRVWQPEAVWKNVFTSPYGTVVSLTESPLVEGLIYAGTDDGLVQVTEDGGESWRRVDRFPGVPDLTYVADVAASHHDPNTVYAVFNNHKEGDFAPYVLRSTDRGRSWTSIASNLPDRQPAWTIVEDPVDPQLLFLGTEFGLFVTRNGGGEWMQLRSGLPVTPVRDLEIQPRENDLVLATFGRGFYILDDYSPLRLMTPEIARREGYLFPIKDPWLYVPSGPLGGGRRAALGDAFYVADNPPFGAVITYSRAESLTSRRDRRLAADAEAARTDQEVRFPPWEELRAEDREVPPAIVLTISDDAGNVVRRLAGPTGAGLHRVAWDLRYPALTPVESTDDDASGPFVAPGRYAAQLGTVVDGDYTALGHPQAFTVKPLGTATLAANDRAGALAFQQQVGQLQRALMAAVAVTDDARNRLQLLRRAARSTVAAPANTESRTRALELRLADIDDVLRGDRTRAGRAEFVPPSIVQRVQRVVRAQFTSTSAPTNTHRHSFEVASDAFGEVLGRLRTLVEEDMAALENELAVLGAPWTPGRRLPSWPRR